MLNKVTLMGRLTSDPELKQIPVSGQYVCTFSIATSRVYYNKKTEEKVEDTTFHRIVSWGKQAEIIATYCKKGHLLYLEGRIENRKWEDDDGNKRTSTEIILEDLKLMPNKKDEGGQPETVSRAIPKRVDPRKKQKEETYDDIPVIENGDEIDIRDIPF